MLDEITITVVGGNGGNGSVSFRRERYVPRGGPDGGDGGKGGDVVVRASESVQVLDVLRKRRLVRAEPGRDGRPAKKRGRDGKGIEVVVPVGTMVWRIDGEQQLLADLDRPQMEVVVARGGRAGRGNARFATPTRQVPRITEKGLPGDRQRIRLELRMLAEVGIVGLPNAGKTSLLRAVSAARPKVGAYPFTTLEPNLGVVEVGYDRFVMADIPGLIEGAHRGAGLGAAFLQHVQRTRLLVHVVDGTQPDPLRDIEVVREELAAFGHGLVEKRWLVTLNKVDLPGARGQHEGVVKRLTVQGIDAFGISALTGEGIGPLIERLALLVREERAKGQEAIVYHERQPLRPAPVQQVQVVQVGKGFEVRGEKATQVVAMLGVESEEARAEIWRRLRRMGVVSALRRAGAQPGDRVRIGKAKLEWLG